MAGEYEDITGSDFESDDDDEIVDDEAPTTSESLPTDVYGGMIFSLISDVPEVMYGGKEDDLSRTINIWRMSFTFLCVMLNYVMQFLLLYFSATYIVTPRIRNMQHVYQAYHRDCFSNEGVLDMSKWDAWKPDQKEAICNMVFSSWTFLSVILIYWYLTMLKEWKWLQQWSRYFNSLNITKNPLNMKDFKEEGSGAIAIKRITPSVRKMLFLIIIVPRFLIWLILLGLGTMWLTATDDFADLILNAVALEFIITVDETIFESLIPKAFAKDIEESSLERPVATKGQHEAETKSGLIRSTTAAVCICALVVFYTVSPWGQLTPLIGVIPDYAHDAACPSYWAEKANQPCSTGPFNLFRKHNCFPYGPDGIPS